MSASGRFDGEDAFKLIKSLRAELFKSRAETQQALGEKAKAESECINAKLKLDQAQASLLEAQQAMNAMSKDRRSNLERALEAATKGIKMQTCRKELSAKLLSRSSSISLQWSSVRDTIPLLSKRRLFLFSQVPASNAADIALLSVPRPKTSLQFSMPQHAVAGTALKSRSFYLAWHDHHLPSL